MTGTAGPAETARVAVTPRVAVIFISYNGARWLRAAVASALDQEPLPGSAPPLRRPAGARDTPAWYEVIVVDNASGDGSAELVEREFPQVRVLRLERNLGFYQGFARAAGQTGAELLVAVPQDVVLHRRWLRELVRVAEADPRVLVAVTNTLAPGSEAYRPGDRPDRDAMPDDCTWVDVAPLGFARLRPGPFDPRPRPTLASIGCSALVRRELLERTGSLFDARVGHYAGDVEAGLRAAVAGGLVMQVPTAVVYHVGEETKAPFDPRLLLRYAAGSRDQVLVYWKLMTRAEFALFLPLLLLGLSFKALELRVRPCVKAALFVAALAATPAVAVAALARIREPEMRAARREAQAARRVPPFWLLRAVLLGPD